MESYGSHLAVNPPRKSVNGDLSAFPLSGVARGPLSTLLFDIFIDDLVAGLHDTCSEHGMHGADRCSKLLYADDECTILHPNGLQS
jgi:hypothetical protein